MVSLNLLGPGSQVAALDYIVVLLSEIIKYYRYIFISMMDSTSVGYEKSQSPFFKIKITIVLADPEFKV